MGQSSHNGAASRNSARFLRDLFERSGYVRIKQDRGARSHHGYELRLAVNGRLEEKAVRSASAALGLRPGRSYTKWNREVLPFYGRRQVELFLAAVKPSLKTPAPRSHRGGKK